MQNFFSEKMRPFSYPEIREQEKFAEKLSHRDILGAVMNLGITREQVGDILFSESVSYLPITENEGLCYENLMTGPTHHCRSKWKLWIRKG